MKSKKICISFETTTSWMGMTFFNIGGQRPIVVENFFKNIGPRQSELLIPTLDRLCRHSKTLKEHISLLAVDIGPGSFTGVRVGVAAARSLAQALGCPLVGVSSLEVMAYRCLKSQETSTVVSCIPALQGELYFAACSLDKKGRVFFQQQPVWKKTEDFDFYLKSLNKKQSVSVIVESWRDDLRDLVSKHPRHRWFSEPVSPIAQTVGEIAIARYFSSPRNHDFARVNPLYLQPSWAERTRNAAASRR